jgi:hypothetical protein
MNVLETIKARASYRGAYLPDAVPRADLETILAAGLAAPSGCNKQTVSLIAVDDPAVLRGLWAVLGQRGRRNRARHGLRIVQTDRRLSRPLFAVQDYSAAIENMLLAIVGLGYESCWVEGHITDADRLGRHMADALGVPAEYELVCYPAGGPRGATREAGGEKAVRRAGVFQRFRAGLSGPAGPLSAHPRGGPPRLTKGLGEW